MVYMALLGTESYFKKGKIRKRKEEKTMSILPDSIMLQAHIQQISPELSGSTTWFTFLDSGESADVNCWERFLTNFNLHLHQETYNNC